MAVRLFSNCGCTGLSDQFTNRDLVNKIEGSHWASYYLYHNIEDPFISGNFCVVIPSSVM